MRSCAIFNGAARRRNSFPFQQLCQLLERSLCLFLFTLVRRERRRVGRDTRTTGSIRVQRYDRQQGARFYTTRLVGADPDSLLISENLPPRLHPEPAEPHTVADSDIQGENAAVLTLLRGDQKTTVKTPDTSLPTVRVSSVEVVDLQGWAALMARIIMDRAQHRAGAA